MLSDVKTCWKDAKLTQNYCEKKWCKYDSDSRLWWSQSYAKKMQQWNLDEKGLMQRRWTCMTSNSAKKKRFHSWKVVFSQHSSASSFLHCGKFVSMWWSMIKLSLPFCCELIFFFFCKAVQPL